MDEPIYLNMTQQERENRWRDIIARSIVIESRAKTRDGARYAAAYFLGVATGMILAAWLLGAI